MKSVNLWSAVSVVSVVVAFVSAMTCSAMICNIFPIAHETAKCVAEWSACGTLIGAVMFIVGVAQANQ